MNITFNFDDRQTAAFKDFLVAGLASLANQQEELSKEIAESKILTELEVNRLINYIKDTIMPQCLIVTEILQSMAVESQSKLYTPSIIH
jgi:hypothetical protein